MENKYHTGELMRWFNRMIGAGWCPWFFVQGERPLYMWRHADEPVFLTFKHAHDIFKQYVNTNGSYIPDPYEVENVP